MRRVVVVALAVLAVAGLAAFVLLRSQPAEPPAVATPSPEDSFDQSFHFEILTWRCRHVNVVAAEKTVRSVEGEFCYVALDVRNAGAQPATIDPSCQFLVDRKGARYTPDPEIMALDDAAVEGFGSEIRPGGLVEDSALFYDVPKWTHPVSLELHESCDGPPIRIRLTQATNAFHSGEDV